MAFVASFPPIARKSRAPLFSRHQERPFSKLLTSSFLGKPAKSWTLSQSQKTFSKLTPAMLGTQQKPKDSDQSSRPPKPTPPPPQVPSRTTIFGCRILMGVAYLGFLSYALFLSPGSLTSSEELKNILTLNIEEVNTVVFSIFCLLGVMPMNYAVALNPGASKKQKVPFLPSVLVSFFAGYGGIGPYLITRRYVPSISKQDVESRGPVARILENRLTSVGTAIFSIYVYIRCLGLFGTPNDSLRDMMFYSSFVDFVRLARVDRFVCVATADLILLSVLMWGPLTEDMRRRGWFVKGGLLESTLTALSILLVPGFGAALYFVLRPPLPNLSSSKPEE